MKSPLVIIKEHITDEIEAPKDEDSRQATGATMGKPDKDPS